MNKHHTYYLNCEEAPNQIYRHKYYMNGALPSSGGWSGKPADWADIRKDCPDNSIALYAGQSTIFTKVGNPTIVNGIASGFSSSNYLTANNSSTATKLEVNVKATITDTSTWQTLFRISNSQYRGLELDNSTGKLRYGYRTVSQTTKFISNIQIATNSPFVFNMIAEDTNLTIKVFQNGTNIFERTVNDSLFSDLLYTFRIGYVGASAFSGSIDLNETYLKINDDYLTNDSQYDNLGFIATCTGGYNVFIDGVQYGTTYASGTQCDITWSTLGINTWDIVTTPSLLKAHKIWIKPATEGNNITKFRCARVKASGNEQQGVLWAHFNISNTIDLYTSFYFGSTFKNGILTAVTARNNIIRISSISNAFAECSLLEYVSVLDGNNSAIEFGATFQSCNKIKQVSLKNIKIKNINFAFSEANLLEDIKCKNVYVEYISSANANNCYYKCYNLKRTIPIISNAYISSANNYITEDTRLEDTIVDFSNCTSLTRFVSPGSTSKFMSGFKGLRVSSEAPFNNATAPQINVSYTGMNRSALVQLFNDLPTVTGGQIINVTGCTGSEDLSAQEVQIATDKGWTVTGGPVFTTYYAYTNENEQSVYATDNPIIPASTEWTQPILTKNGTMGGDTCAVETNIPMHLDAAAWHGFDNNNSTYFHSTSGSTVGYFTFYSPLPICVTKITFTNQDNGFSNRASASGTIYGSNDNANWTTITTYTYSGTTSPWDIDVPNTNYYKYYKVYSNGTISDSYWTFSECKFTATKQITPSTLYNNTFTPLDPQPTFTVHTKGIQNLINKGCTDLGNGIYQGSAGNIIQTNFIPDFANANTWEIATKYTYDTGNSYATIFGYGYYSGTSFIDATSPYIGTEGSSTFRVFLPLGSQGWAINNFDTGVNKTGTTWIKLKFTGTQYIFSYKKQENDPYTDVLVTSSSTKTYCTSPIGFLNLPYNMTTYASLGTIDFKETSITIDGITTIFYVNNSYIVINDTDYVRNPSEDTIA